MRCKTLEQHQSRKHGFRSKARSLFTKMISFTTAMAMLISLLSVDGFALVAEARETSDGKLIWSTNAGDFPVGQCTEWVVPVTGTYHIEMRGGNGGSSPGNSVPSGAGAAYEVSLIKGQTYYIAVGGNGTVDRNLFIRGEMTGGYAAGGWNGGGASTTRAGSGGGATAIYTAKIDDGQLVNYAKYNEDKVVAVVGGGGGAYYAMEFYSNIGVGTGSWYDCHTYTGPSEKHFNGFTWDYATHYHTRFVDNPILTDWNTEGYCPSSDVKISENGKGQNGINDTSNGVVSEVGNSRYTTTGKSIDGYKTRGSSSNGNFGKGKDSPITANVGYAGAGGGGLYGGLAVDTNNYRAAVGGGGSGKKWGGAKKELSYSMLASSGVSIEYLGEKHTLVINLYKAAYYNNQIRDKVVITGYELEKVDLSSIRASAGHVLADPPLVKTGAGTLNGRTYTFGNGDATIDVKYTSPGSINIIQEDANTIVMAYINKDISMEQTYKAYLNGVLKSEGKKYYDALRDNVIYQSSDNTGGTVTLGNNEKTSPKGIYEIYAYGAGGSGSYTGANGGRGGLVYGTYSISSPTTFNISIGQRSDDDKGGTGYYSGGKSGNRNYSKTLIVDTADGNISESNGGKTTITLQGNQPTGGAGATAVSVNGSLLLLAGGGGGASNTTKAKFAGWQRQSTYENANAYSPYTSISVNGVNGTTNGKSGGENRYYTTYGAHYKTEETAKDFAIGVSGGGGGGFLGGNVYVGKSGSCSSEGDTWANNIGSGAFHINGNRLGGTKVIAYNGTSYVNISHDLYKKGAYNSDKDNTLTALEKGSEKKEGLVKMVYRGKDIDANWYGVFHDLNDVSNPEILDTDMSINDETLTLNVSAIDHGTPYVCKLVAESAIREEFEEVYTNTSGVKTFKYYIDSQPAGNAASCTTVVSAKRNDTNKSGSISLSWKTTDFTTDQWLHIVAVDGANNKSEVKNIRITELYKISYELNGGEFGSSHPNYAGYNQDIEISNPTRAGFKFLGWNIANMDESDGSGGGEHYWGSANGTYEVTSTASSATFNETLQYTHFKNLRNRRLLDVPIETVYLEAVWIDEQSPAISVGYKHIRDNNDILTAVCDGAYSLLTVQDVNISSANKNAGVTWANASISELTGSRSQAKSSDYFKNYQTGSEYPTNTWTSQSVTVTATAGDGGTSSPTAGGSGFLYKPWFQDSKSSNPDAKEQVNYSASDNLQKTVTNTKTYVDSCDDNTDENGYKGKIYAEDRAKFENTATSHKWISNDQLFTGQSTNSGYISELGHVTVVNYGRIHIDKEKPTLELEYTYYGIDTANVTDANIDVKLISDKGSMKYWASSNVKLTVSAKDSLSGIKNAAFCWVDENIAKNSSSLASYLANGSNWQAADKILPDGTAISTKVFIDNTWGYCYVRDAVGNWERVEYKIEHVDKDDPKGGGDEEETEDDDPEDYPDPEEPYDGFDGTERENDMVFDWINSNAALTFNAKDYEVTGSGQTTDGASGIWTMTLYQSDVDFTTEEVIPPGKKNPVKRALRVDAEGKSLVLKKVVNSEVLNYTEIREGMNFLILEIVDCAGNVTNIYITVKIDKTYPGIPNSSQNESADERFVGNCDKGKFDDGQYWTIVPVSLDNVDTDKIEDYIKNEDNMMTSFFFTLFDRNFSGNYAYHSNKDIDDSGFAKVTLELYDVDTITRDAFGTIVPAANSVGASYVLYDYADSNAATRTSGTSSTGRTFKTAIDSSANTYEEIVRDKLLDTTCLPNQCYSSLSLKAKINTMAEFPGAASLAYRIIITDRAGNEKILCNTEGNEIPNFAIRSIIHSGEDEKFDTDYEVKKQIYDYNNHFASVEKTYKYNLPYFQLGDRGYVEVWTIGYVKKIQTNFGSADLVRDGNISIGEEMIKEIKEGRIPAKYNLGTYSGGTDPNYYRLIDYTKGEKVNVSYASDVSGIPFATRYGRKEAMNYALEKPEYDVGWLSDGVAIRMPIYYNLMELIGDSGEVETNKDGTPKYASEMHQAAVYAWKSSANNASAPLRKSESTALYAIWDTNSNDLHYRVTH